MPLIPLRLADMCNNQRGYLVLADRIPISAIDFRPMETLHICISENGKPLVDGSQGVAYSHEGGSLQRVLAISEGMDARSVLEIEVSGLTLGTFALRDKEAQADLTEWKKEIPLHSVVMVKQISTQSQSKKIDVFLVIQNAGILP